tara:strand:+ start:61748 stop:62050 length:303 start_codon:yes stop_codon:yes gene_type:complete
MSRERITAARLEALARTLNRVLGTPEDQFSTGLDNHLQENPGNFHISMQNDGYELQQVCETGGTTGYSQHGHGTARQCYEYIHAFMDGAMAVKRAAGGGA